MRRALVFLSSVVTIVITACASDPKPGGELVLEIQTDVPLPESVDSIRIEVLSGDAVQFGQDYPVGAGNLLVPGTLGLLPGGDAAKPYTIRLIARKGDKGKMLREVVTTIPTTVTTRLRLPIEWLCDRSATEIAPGKFATACPDPAQTCVAGSCVDRLTGAGGTPFVPGEVACFDVVPCVKDGTPVIPDDACTIDKPAGAFNIGLGADGGICPIPGSTDCFVILEHAEAGGWHELPNGRIQLPDEVCRRRTSGRVKMVLVSTTCAPKTENQPTCGPWTGETAP